MQYKLVKQIRDNDALRRSFIDLANGVFHISFQPWYESGYWTDQYVPYVFAVGEKVIANASVNIIDIRWKDNSKRYIQIGTVMVDPAYRHRGLMRLLIEEIIRDWKECCDSLYLFANKTVLDFYPKFGFERAFEYQHVMTITGEKCKFRKLDMNLKSDRILLKLCYQRGNPFSCFGNTDNYGLLMFYCDFLLKDCIYYSVEKNMVCIAEQNGDALLCYDIYGSGDYTLEEIILDVASSETRKTLLGFPPITGEKYNYFKIDSDDYLFILSGKENLFTDRHLIFPLLSHA